MLMCKSEGTLHISIPEVQLTSPFRVKVLQHGMEHQRKTGSLLSQIPLLHRYYQVQSTVQNPDNTCPAVIESNLIIASMRTNRTHIMRKTGRYTKQCQSHYCSQFSALMNITLIPTLCNGTQTKSIMFYKLVIQ